MSNLLRLGAQSRSAKKCIANSIDSVHIAELYLSEHKKFKGVRSKFRRNPSRISEIEKISLLLVESTNLSAAQAVAIVKGVVNEDKLTKEHGKDEYHSDGKSNGARGAIIPLGQLQSTPKSRQRSNRSVQSTGSAQTENMLRGLKPGHGNMSASNVEWNGNGERRSGFGPGERNDGIGAGNGAGNGGRNNPPPQPQMSPELA
jgi:hypothetical protein